MKNLFIAVFAFFLLAFTAKSQCIAAVSFLHSDVEFESRSLSLQQLFDTANHYFYVNDYNRALAYFDLVINAPIRATNLMQIEMLVEALNRSATIFRRTSDFRNAHDFLIEALRLCEAFNLTSLQPSILINIGNIHYYFSKFEEAKFYYETAAVLIQDSIGIVRVLNNLGATELRLGNLETAHYLLSRALQISKRHNDAFLHNIKSNFALYHRKSQDYNLAFYYHWLSLDEARRSNRIEKEAMFLSYLGELFFEVGKTDSALLYVDLSKQIAEKHGFLKILANNYWVLSKIKRFQGRHREALEHFEKHANIRDSIFGSTVLSDINQLQRSFELSRKNRQIEQLIIEQKVKENTIRYQKIIQYISLLVLLFVSVVLVFIFFQNKRLNVAYKVLFEKNIELVEFQKNALKPSPQKKITRSVLTQDAQDDIADKVLILMKDTSIICDPEFSIDKLADLLNSNQKYVSEAINNSLKKNFRSLLSTYRVQEAQRLLADLDTTKYTIDSVAFKVGYKSPNSFRNTFKEITGVSPGFYLKSIKNLSNS